MKQKLTFFLSVLLMLSALCLNAQIDTTASQGPSGADLWSVISGILALCDVTCPIYIKVIAPIVLGWFVAILKKRKEHKKLAGIITTTLALHKGDLPPAHETALHKLLDHLKRKKKNENQ